MYQNPIIPQQPIYLHKGFLSQKSFHSEIFDYESIALWTAIGFFLGDSTFYKDIKVLLPSTQFRNGKKVNLIGNGIILLEIYHYLKQQMNFRVFLKRVYIKQRKVKKLFYQFQEVLIVVHWP